MHSLAELILDLENYPNIFKRVTSSEIISSNVVHITLDMPFPFAIRDYIVRFNIEKNDSSWTFSYSSVKEGVSDPKPGYVRLNDAAGIWKLKRISQSNTLVTYTWNGQLLGNFPEFGLEKAWITQGNEVFLLANFSACEKKKSMKKLILLASLTHLQLKGELLSPEDGSVINHIHVFFEWTQIPEATAYDFQLSSDPSYNIVNVEVTDNSLGFVEEELIEWGTTYFWRVRPIFALGTGTWSESYSFTTTESMSSSSVNLIQDCCYGNGITVFGAFFNYFSAAIDKTGREIWNSGNTDFVYYGTSQNGNVFGANLILGSDNNLPGSEIDFEGNVIWQEPNDEFLHHDLILLPNGNYLGIVETTSLGPIPIGSWTSSFQTFGFQANGITDEFPWVGDKIVEWDRDTKEVVWSWNVFDYFSMEDYDRIGGTWNEALQSLRYDWTHINAVIFDNEESSIYISVRHLSRITKIAYPSGDVIWNLGHDMPSGDVHLGTDIGFSFQHGLQKLENGNILTLDNGNLSPEFRGTSQPITRAIEIQIDGLEASTIWSHELAPDLFGFASGNAQKLPNGNVLITTVGGGGRSVEVNTSGDIVWEGLYNFSIPDGAVYRAHRIPGLFPAAFTFIVNELVDNNGQPEVRLPVGDSEISFQGCK